MNQVIGQLGAFLMMVLITTLACKFMMDLHWIKKEETKKGLIQVGAFATVAGLLYLLFGGLIYNYTQSPASALDLGTIWHRGNGAEILDQLESMGTVSLGNRLFVLLGHVMGNIFFQQYVAAAWYLSFFFGVMTCFLLWKTVSKIMGEKIAREAVCYLAVFPGLSYRLFIPDGVSLYTFLILLVLCLIVHKKPLVLSEEQRTVWERRLTGTVSLWVWTGCVVINGFLFYQFFTGWWK